MNNYKPSNSNPEDKPLKDTEIPKKQQDDPNKLQKPGGAKDKYVPKPGSKGLDEENPSRDYDNEKELE